MIQIPFKRIRRKFLQLMFLTALISIIPIYTTVRADMGLKPEMEFKFIAEDGQQSFSIKVATLYECQQADCSDAQPIDEIGPQRLNCQKDICKIYFYGLEPYYRLEVNLEDGRTLISHPFAPRGFHSYYSVVVRENEMLVQNRFALDLFASPICLSVCGSLWLVAFWVLLSLFWKHR